MSILLILEIHEDPCLGVTCTVALGDVEADGIGNRRMRV
jgi:hypothetical protein